MLQIILGQAIQTRSQYVNFLMQGFMFASIAEPVGAGSRPKCPRDCYPARKTHLRRVGGKIRDVRFRACQTYFVQMSPLGRKSDGASQSSARENADRTTPVSRGPLPNPGKEKLLRAVLLRRAAAAPAW